MLALLSAPALPQSQALAIDNTAYVTYGGASGGGGRGTIEVTSNTVTFVVLPTPTPAVIDFFAYSDPGTPGAVDFPVDGGECQDDHGGYGPLPAQGNIAAAAAGGGIPITAAPARQYVPGQTIVIRVQDANRNEDPTRREAIEVTVTTSIEDRETLRLRETDVDTGVFATAIPSVAVPPPPTHHDCRLSVGPDTVLTASYVDPGFPDDTSTTTAAIVDIPNERLLLLEKSVSVPEASIGDFLQYRLVVANDHAGPVLDVRIEDRLPPGLRYQAGSLHVDGVRAVPEVSEDGRRLVIPVGGLAAEGRAVVTYVAVVGPGARVGDAVNRAQATGRAAAPAAAPAGPLRALGGVVSNEAEAVVRIREPLFTSRFTIIGQVLSGACDASAADLAPVPGVRLVLDDGTYVVTDDNGAYHLAAVRPGTHVVQVDVATLPAGLEAAPCRQDTRFAGRGLSQFVEAEGGALMRADFRLQPQAAAQGEVGLRVQLARREAGLRATVTLDAPSVDAGGLRAMAMLPAGAAFVPGSARRDGAVVADPGVAGEVLTFELGTLPAGGRTELAFEVLPGTCSAPGPAVMKAVALFDAGGARRTPPAEASLACDAPDGASDSGRQPFEFSWTPAAQEAVSPSREAAESLAARRAAMDAHATVPSGDRDWLTGQAPGNAWLLPGSGSAADPTEAVVVKHLPGHSVVLRLNGKPVGGLHFNGSRTNADGTVSVAMWRGVPMAPGANALEAQVIDPSGRVVETLARTLHHASEVVRAEFVPAESLLVADGIQRPVIAVRMLDKAGKPVRAGTSGAFSVLPPHAAAIEGERQQQRQLAGMESFRPTWRVEGDDGVAYIELQPTGTSGEVVLGFDFRVGDRGRNAQEVKAWLKSTPRDWIVVGFAKGTVGYDTLDGNMQGLEDAGHEAGLGTDGQLSLYAKGRVLGKWMLTLAYDSDKATSGPDRQALLSAIDPNRFYTLYGDGTQQGYDASSTDKLYLKLERDQFQALFGDFVTGLDDGELARYHRTLNGVKVEYRGPVFELDAFGARTRQDFARDEIQGDGTSGLYRLSRSNIAVNGERVRIEVRDRLRSEVIVESRTLARHVDYDIDYAAGTLFFREPVQSRDFDFNPVFIVVEYETHGNGEEFLNAGGRAGVRLLDGRLRAGLTYIDDEDSAGRTRLGAVDAALRVGAATEVRAEYAASEGESGPVDRSGDAYLVEVEHHGEQVDLLAYVRRQDGGFGLGQQNLAERGTFKVGADVQWRIADDFSLQAQASHQEHLASGATRNALHVQGEYRGADWGVRAGLQWVRDQARDGRVAESRLVTLGANRAFLGDRLELTARADVAVGGRDDSVDYPTRLELGASYALTDALRVVVAQEFTDGDERDTSTTRFGFEAQPWAGATLSSTLNQSRISEYGPRTFGVLGLAQKFLVGERWSVDLSADGSHTIDAPGEPLVVNPAHQIAPGGFSRVGALAEDFLALSAGATYRTELWSATGRLEHRDGEQADRFGFTAGFLRQATDGIAFAAQAQGFVVDNLDGSRGTLATATLAWAWRPLGSRWSILDRLEVRMDELRGGAGAAVVAGDTLAVGGDARSTRVVNNFVLNFVGDPWTEQDRRGNLFDVSQRSELSLFYGSKYVFDTYDGQDHAGYTDILGIDWRHDLSPKLDLGLRASMRHAWSEDAYAYAIGPSLGFTPFTNAWFSLGYNVIGFNDRDFEAMHYTAQGPYLMMRFKFDQQTLGLARAGRAGAP